MLETLAMVVVVGQRSPLLAVLAVIIIVILVVVALFIFIISGVKGTMLVVVIPGFPNEAIILGLALGVILVTLRRKFSRKGSVTGA